MIKKIFKYNLNLYIIFFLLTTSIYSQTNDKSTDNKQPFLTTDIQFNTIFAPSYELIGPKIICSIHLLKKQSGKTHLFFGPHVMSGYFFSNDEDDPVSGRIKTEENVVPLLTGASLIGKFGCIRISLHQHGGVVFDKKEGKKKTSFLAADELIIGFIFEDFGLNWSVGATYGGGIVKKLFYISGGVTFQL